MFEAIKSLSVKQRLFGFIFAVVIMSITSILTVYFKTSDCKPISDQYISLSKNQSILMATNNRLSSSYDSLFNDMLKVNGEVRRLKFIIDSIENSRFTNITINKTNLKLEKTTKPILLVDSIFEITNKYDSCGIKP